MKFFRNIAFLKKEAPDLLPRYLKCQWRHILKPVAFVFFLPVILFVIVQWLIELLDSLMTWLEQWFDAYAAFWRKYIGDPSSTLPIKVEIRREVVMRQQAQKKA